jgi:protein-disulfide isomerase
MPNPHRRSLLIAAVACATLALAACNKGAGQVTSADDMTLGDPKAKVKVVEYASASCSHCAAFNNEVFPAFKKKYIDTGKVHYTLKEFITPPADMATAAFLMARCVGKDRYFDVLDAVFHGQEEVAQTGDTRGVLLRIAQGAGMTEAQFSSCVSDEAAIKALNARVERAVKKDGITGTPTFVVNGKTVGAGEVSLSQLDEAIAEASK